MDDFSPEINTPPSSLDSDQLLSKLPETYLANPSASNFIALGVTYCLMGLGAPEDPGYIDRLLAGVFTAINDKAVELGLPAFEPPTTLSHVASSRTSYLVDSYMTRQADKA